MKRHMVLVLFLAIVLLVSLSRISWSQWPQPKEFEVDHDFYPYYPSLIKWDKSTTPFTEPEVCAGCHPDKFKEWTGSMHSMAFQDPVYQGELNKGFKAVGHEVTRQCEGCHSPAGVVTGEIKGPGLKGLSAMAMAGVSCDICHSISGVTHWQTPTHEAENGSFILTPGVDATGGTELTKRGPLTPYDGCGMGFHVCIESPLHMKADLCASCHNVYHYDDQFPIEATYNEWKHGPYAQKGIMCQDCHMVEIDVFKRSADTFQKPVREEYHHYFNGANYLLYYLAKNAAEKAGNQELAANLTKKYEMSIERLKLAADLEIFPVYQNNELTEVKIRVKNIRAGHNLPTSLTNVREMWLEIIARDETGKVIMSSGQLDEHGKLMPESRIFNSDGMGKDFHFSLHPWVITAFSRHETIPPRGYKDIYYGVPPMKSPQRIMIETKLRYRQADQEVAEDLLSNVPPDIILEATYGLKKVPTLPVVDMVEKKMPIYTMQ